jgi:predicted ATP-dependent endonuclease of OLD family
MEETLPARCHGVFVPFDLNRSDTAGRMRPGAQHWRRGMKCKRVEFAGFKRLLDATCSLDDRLIAFVGPNEAGKSSVLGGLAWMDAADSDPLPVGLASRGQPPGQRSADDTIVETFYRLEPADWAALNHLKYALNDAKPTYRLWKLRSGRLVHRLDPPLVRDPQPFVNARKALGRAPRAVADALAAADEAFESADPDELSPERALHDSCIGLLDDTDHKASGEEVEGLRRFSAWLQKLGSNEAKPTLVAAGNAAAHVADLLAAEHPNDAALSILDTRRPRFREFHRADRELENEVDITDKSNELSAPFRRVLDLAGTDESHVRQVWGEEGERDTHLAACNDRLNAFFKQAWTQSDLSIHLKAEHHLLKIQVKVFEGGKTYLSTFGERSDGLKAFVALVGFLHSLPDNQPPILLIDEAETHLHLDAQADLIDVLQDRVSATQVFYTTHSPGCLPVDLGRGLRFVEPTDQHYSSKLSHNFWDTKYPGFSAVLFKMGAGAFAFSSLRKAVLAEGAGDMILLPRLIREASDLETLTYQVAPRMNDFDESKVDRREVAASVAYLVDGDKGGRDRRKNLRRK